jgi:thiosulfate dehydrogenase [quinone] large subunit
MTAKSPSKLSHALRMAIFLLRIAIGLNFFYFGFAVLFNPTLSKDFRAQSFNNLYSWLAAPAMAGWVHPFAQWAFLIIGACLILGLATRIASIVGIAVTFLSFLPNVSYNALTMQQFINDEIIVIICLLVILLSDAGNYLGIDRFIHVSFRHKPSA